MKDLIKHLIATLVVFILFQAMAAAQISTIYYKQSQSTFYTINTNNSGIDSPKFTTFKYLNGDRVEYSIKNKNKGDISTNYEKSIQCFLVDNASTFTIPYDNSELSGVDAFVITNSITGSSTKLNYYTLAKDKVEFQGSELNKGINILVCHSGLVRKILAVLLVK